jgi:hypothetical protein
MLQLLLEIVGREKCSYFQKKFISDLDCPIISGVVVKSKKETTHVVM